MKRSNVIGILAAAAVIVLSVVLISWYLTKRTPTLIQGTVECTTYKGLVEGSGPHRRHESGPGRPRGEGTAPLHALDARTGGQAPAGRGREERRRGVGRHGAGRRPRAADRGRDEHVAEGAGRAGTGPQDLRARAEPLQRRSGSDAEARRSHGQLQGHGGHGAGRQGAVRHGDGRRPQRRTRRPPRPVSARPKGPSARWSRTSATRWSIRP